MVVEGQTSLGLPKEARICVFSQRHLQRCFSACADYEFEDLLCEFDDADILSAQPYYGRQITRRISNRLAKHASVAWLSPGVRKLRVARNYDLLFAKLLVPVDVLSLNALKRWRGRCRVAICWLAESWANEASHYKGYSKILSQFDYIVLNCSSSVAALQDMTGRPCFYIPPGVDAIRFCPYPNPPLRSIDVYSIGRRSPVIHSALLKMAEQGRLFYIYDTMLDKNTAKPREHRDLIANIAKRSRYFLVNPGKFDRGFETGGQTEIGFRYFEGAAAGTVMIGGHPETEAFRHHFDWPDSVINAPFDSPNIADVLADLDSQPGRMEQARKNNIVQSLLCHDWAYRWQALLDIAGLKPRTALTDRLERLKELAEIVQRA